MHLRSVMIDRYPDRQPVSKEIPEPQQSLLALRHRLHGIGQYQRPETTRQDVVEHLRQLAVHEGFASSKPDQRGRKTTFFYLVEVSGDLRSRQVGEPVVFRRRLDIAVVAG